MTQKKGTEKRAEELTEIFLKLNEKGQESALTILKSLEFAQSVMCREDNRVFAEDRSGG